MRTTQIDSLISRVKTKDPVLYEILRNLNLDSRDSGQNITSVSGTQDQQQTDLTALQAAVAALQALIPGLATQAALDALTLTFNNHKNRHVSGGGDAFIATDLLDALVKRIRSITADLEFGTIADGEFLKRSGNTIVGDTPSGGDTIFIPTTNGDPADPGLIFDEEGGLVLLEVPRP